MYPIALDELWTLVVALLTIGLCAGVAWAGLKLAARAGNAFELGMACATLGLVASGVVATQLLDRAAHTPGAGTAEKPVHGDVTLHGDEDDARFGLRTSSDRWLRQWLGLGATIGIALAFTNLADLLKQGVDLETADQVGTVALRLFLAMSLISLDLTAVFRAAGPILNALVLQCLVAALIAVTLVRHAAKRGSQAARDGAVGVASWASVWARSRWGCR